MSKKPKTSGYRWVEFSLIAFNGSGYASRSSAEEFLDSYIAYSKWKNRPNGVTLASEFYQPLLVLSEQLRQGEISQKPSAKGWAKFQASRSNTSLL